MGEHGAPLASVSSNSLQCFWRSGFAPVPSPHVHHERTAIGRSHARRHPPTQRKVRNTPTRRVRNAKENFALLLSRATTQNALPRSSAFCWVGVLRWVGGWDLPEVKVAGDLRIWRFSPPRSLWLSLLRAFVVGRERGAGHACQEESSWRHGASSRSGTPLLRRRSSRATEDMA